MMNQIVREEINEQRSFSNSNSIDGEKQGS